MAERVDHTHGDTGTKPTQSLNFQDGDYPDPETFDWFWSQVPSAINDHADFIEAIDPDGDNIIENSSVEALINLSPGDTISQLPLQHGSDVDTPPAAHHAKYTDEEVMDVVNALLDAGGKISLNYDDQNDTLTISTTGLEQEEVEDEISNTLVGGTGISISYDDTAGEVTITAHTKYTDSEAVSAVNNDSDHGSTASHNYYTDSEAISATDGVIDADTLDGSHGSAFQKKANTYSPPALVLPVGTDQWA